ncbi:MAG TPA: hypothetical protein VFE88_00890 [Candidatus Nanoarchaeia archaeon]|nr:hypothetical protein [Candidatus Nanoarchaeia archaeon]
MAEEKTTEDPKETPLTFSAPSAPTPGPHLDHKGESLLNGWALSALLLVAVLVIVNQFLLLSLEGTSIVDSATRIINLKRGNANLDTVDITQIHSTPQGIAAVFPLDTIKTADDALALIVPTGTPEYGEAMGISFDDPINSLTLMQNGYSALKKQVQDNQELWQRYLGLAAAPRGISCEFCCGIGAQGVDSNGELRCGCSHNPALQTLTFWLLLNTDSSDAEILREVYKWKAAWYPKNMIQYAMQIAGGDISVLEELPGMVGGC